MKAASELEMPKKHVLKLRDQVRDNFAVREAAKDAYVSKQKDAPKEHTVSTQERLRQLRTKTAGTSQKEPNNERLRRLRERKPENPERGPEFER